MIQNTSIQKRISRLISIIPPSPQQHHKTKHIQIILERVVGGCRVIPIHNDGDRVSSQSHTVNIPILKLLQFTMKNRNNVRGVKDTFTPYRTTLHLNKNNAGRLRFHGQVMLHFKRR